MSKEAPFWSYHFLLFAIAAFLVGGFLIISSELHAAANVDAEILSFFGSLRRPWLNAVAVDFTALGSTTVITLVTILFAAFMWMRDRRDLVIQIVVASVGAALLSTALKLFFGRERPTLLEKLIVVQSHSYPSGHSLTSAAVYLTLALLLCALLSRKFHQAITLSLAGIVVFLIGLSRIYLGVHYPSDVLAGLMLGTSWALVLAAFAHRKEIFNKGALGNS